MTQAFNLAQLANNLNTSGQLDATDGLNGLVANANLASSGTASSSTFLRGDRTWASAGLQAASVAEAQAWTSDTVAITPLKLANAFQGANYSLSSNGYQKIPGGLILQFGAFNVGAFTNTTITMPITFPNYFVGITGGIHIPSNSTYNSAIRLFPNTNSTFNAQNGDSGGICYVYWLAIGY